jgi:hypothetical protein
MVKHYVQGTPSRPGPEADLVEEFINIGLPAPRKGETRSVFIEPRLGMSKPDIVVVYWNSSIKESWPQTRLSLDEIDLRLAHLLFIAGPHAEAELRAIFPRQLQDSLVRLRSAGLVRFAKQLWCLRNFSENFAVRRIITFEAKISSLSRALDQAYLNTWFASESYVLTTTKRPMSPMIERAQRQGIGIWLLSKKTTSMPLVDAKRNPLPQSYASWLFNELAWKTCQRIC